MSEYWTDPHEDYRPVFSFNGYPVYAATLLVVLHSVAMITCSLLLAMHLGGFLNLLTFSGTGFWSAHRFWTPLTYAFVHFPSLWFLVEMFMLYQFGRELEKFIGRRAFLLFYTFLLLAPALVMAVASRWWPLDFSGSSALHFAVFIGFVTIYPSVEFIFRIQARWVALLLLSIYTLQCLAGNDWTTLSLLWISSACAFIGIRLTGAGGGFPKWEEWNENRRQNRAIKASKLHVVREEKKQQSIDDILGKISKSGMTSLTSAERSALEKARTELLQKEKRK